MKPSEEAKNQFEGILWVGRAFGCFFFDGNLFHPRMVFVWVVGAIEQVMHYHGLSEVWPDVGSICSSLAVYCLIIQLLTRLLSRFVRAEEDKILAMLKTLLTFYEREEQNHDHRAILTTNLKSLRYFLDFYMRFNLVLFCGPSLTSFVVSWYTGELTLFTPIYLPIVDPHVLSGYIFSSILLVFYSTLVLFIFMSADVVFIFFVYQCIPMVNIYNAKMKSFGEKLLKTKSEKEKPTDHNQLEPSTSKGVVNVKTQKQLEDERIKEIERVEQELIVLIEEFNDYNGYVKTVTSFMEYTFFTAMTLNSMSLAMGIVIILKSSIFLGISTVSIFSMQILLPCVVGTMISSQKEKLFGEIFAFPWYELTLRKQKIFLQFIHLVQNSNELEVPYIGPMNMELFTDMVNGAYSYLMYLLKFLN